MVETRREEQGRGRIRNLYQEERFEDQEDPNVQRQDEQRNAQREEVAKEGHDDIEGMQGQGRGNVDPIQRFTEVMTGIFQGNIQITPPNQPQQPPRKGTFKDFSDIKPPTFHGHEGPTRAQNWVKEMEKAFELAEIEEKQRVKFSNYFMKDECNFWWESAERAELAKYVMEKRADKTIYWARFTDMFFEKYLPIRVKDELEEAFLNLKQGSMTVAQYEAKFIELSRFAPHQVDTERRKARRFESGLNPWIAAKVAVFASESFEEVVEKAKIAEAAMRATQQYNQDQKKEKKDKGSKSSKRSTDNKSYGSTSQKKAKTEDGASTEKSNNNNKKESNNNISNNNNNKDNRNKKKQKNKLEEGAINDGGQGRSQRRKVEIKCSNCGKDHGGTPCLSKKKVCFRCRQPGHPVQSCPLNQKGENQGRDQNPGELLKLSCFTCGMVGHMSSSCTQQGSKERVTRSSSMK